MERTRQRCQDSFASAQTTEEELPMQSQTLASIDVSEAINRPDENAEILPFQRMPPRRVSEQDLTFLDPLLTADEVAARLRVSKPAKTGRLATGNGEREDGPDRARSGYRSTTKTRCR